MPATNGPSPLPFWIRASSAAFGAVFVLASLGSAIMGIVVVAKFSGEPMACEGATCPPDTWVHVTDADWRCEAAVATEGGQGAPIEAPGGPALLAVMEPEDRCGEATAEGTLGQSYTLADPSRPVRVLWLEPGPEPWRNYVGGGVCQLLVGLFFLLLGSGQVTWTPARK